MSWPLVNPQRGNSTFSRLVTCELAPSDGGTGRGPPAVPVRLSPFFHGHLLGRLVGPEAPPHRMAEAVGLGPFAEGNLPDELGADVVRTGDPVATRRGRGERAGAPGQRPECGEEAVAFVSAEPGADLADVTQAATFGNAEEKGAELAPALAPPLRPPADHHFLRAHRLHLDPIRDCGVRGGTGPNATLGHDALEPVVHGGGQDVGACRSRNESVVVKPGPDSPSDSSRSRRTS